MRYAIIDLDLSRPVPGISLAQDERGMGLLLRRSGRPVAFVMKRLRAGAELTSAELRRLIAEKAAPELLAAAIADELRGPSGIPGPVDLTIAICTRARADDLRACLESLLAIRGRGVAGPGSFELLVIDNAPPDKRTRTLVESLEGVRYVREPVRGLDVARNRALREARGSYVAFLDDDTVADAGWLAGLEEAVADQPDAAVITGLVLPHELETIAQILFERRGGFRRGFRKLRYAGERCPDNPLYPLGAGVFGTGANMVVRKDVVLALGGFDEALDNGSTLPGGGDLDIFYRVLRAGHALAYEPRMLVFHKHRRDYRRMLRQYRTWGTGLVAFLEKTAAADPSQEEKVRRMRRWWVRYQLRELVKGMRRAGPALPDQVFAELAGGLIGLTGAYGRSRRRTERLRRNVA
jgi:glycosyltransferase involved in cell wall biosynthesis